MTIKIDHIGYGNHILVRDIAFTVSPGECLLLAGANGSGKTTLLKALAGGAIPSETHGHPRPCKREGPVGEADGRGRSEAEAVSGGIAPPDQVLFIPTGIPKVKGFSVREFVRTGCYRESDWAGRLRPRAETRLEESLKLLGLSHLAERDIATLSDGEFQKACIAVGLTRRAGLLLLDEPTAFLDVENRLMVLRSLQEAASETGTAVIFSSHDLHDALQVARRVLAITPDGRLLESGPENREAVLARAFPHAGW